MIGASNRKNCFAAFRIVCHQLLYFAHDKSETLNPDEYNCVRCFRVEKDLARGCPGCALTDKYEHYKQEIVADIRKELKQAHPEWPLKRLLILHGQIGQLLARTRDRISRTWDTRTVRLAEIMISTRIHKQNVDSWARRQQMDWERRKRK